MFEFDFRNIIVFVSLAIHALLLWILFRYGRKTPGGKAYSIAILAIAGWVLPMTFYRAHFFGEVLLWARLLYIMASFTSTSFFFFTLVFPENKKIPLWLQLFIVLENLAIISIILHPTWMIRGVQIVKDAEDVILWGPLYFVYVNHISLYFLAGFVTLFRKMRKASGVLHKQIATILTGYFVAANLAMTTNLILPWFGYFELNWIGQFFSTLVAAFTTYAILKHKLLNIKVLATESFILLLNLFLFFQFILSGSPVEFAVNALLLFAVMVISYLTIRSVAKEVERRREVTELAESLEKANLRLLKLDKQKTEFLSIASHQLRTPLSIIKGYIELISDGAYGKPTRKMKKILGDIDSSNERLVKLVDDFLNISRIEQGRTKYIFEYNDLAETIDGAVKELQEKAEEKDMQIEWKKEDECSIFMDEEKIRHVVFNFVDNAIKYSTEGVVKVFLEHDGVDVTVRVVDDGIGFKKADGANFFQKFYRGENVKNTNVNGTGLGIYVCKMFIDAHSGKVWAKSPGLGKGSEFGFTIPIEQGDRPAELQMEAE